MRENKEGEGIKLKGSFLSLSKLQSSINYSCGDHKCNVTESRDNISHLEFFFIFDSRFILSRVSGCGKIHSLKSNLLTSSSVLWREGQQA